MRFIIIENFSELFETSRRRKASTPARKAWHTWDRALRASKFYRDLRGPKDPRATDKPSKSARRSLP